MKKLCFALVAVVLAISLLFTGCGRQPSVSIGKAKGRSGEVVEVKIDMGNNPGIWGGQLIIDYDSVNFSFDSISNGSVFETCESNDNGNSVILVLTHSITTNAKLKNSTNNGTIATLKFKVKTGVTKGKYDITINEESNFCNANEELIEVAFAGGQIKVK